MHRNTNMKRTYALIVAHVVAGVSFSAAPVVTITPVGTTEVANSVGTYTFTVTNNTECVGGIRWFNGRHDLGTYVPTTTNRALSVALKPGMNTVAIIGTNNWATGTVTMVACTNVAYVNRSLNIAEPPFQGILCHTGTVSQWTWVKVSMADLNSGALDTNADVVIPFAPTSIEITPMAGDSSSIFVATTTNQSYSAAFVGPRGELNIVNFQIHPFSANVEIPFVTGPGINAVYIKGSVTNCSYQVKAEAR